MLELKITQAILLKQAVAPITIMATEATIIYSPAGIALQALDLGGIVMAMIRINASSFDYFQCTEGSEAGVDLNLLSKTLSRVEEEETVTIHGDEDDKVIGFILENAVDRKVRYIEMTLIDVPDGHVDIDEYQFEYEVVVGIPSEQFRRILMHLSFFGKTVHMHVTDYLVKISAANKDVSLTTEDKECIIGGVAADKPISLSFSLNHMTSFLNASLLSDTVWILNACNSPTLLNCPIGVLGNIMFYFV